MLKKVKPFQRLNINQWVWLFEAYWRLWIVVIRIKVKQENWLQDQIKIVAINQVNKAGSNEESDLGLAMHESVRLAARLHFLSAQCLPRAITLANMLVARGYDAQVILGVAKVVENCVARHSENGVAEIERRLSSHAWVELNDVMLGEPESVKHDFVSLGSRR